MIFAQRLPAKRFTLAHSLQKETASLASHQKETSTAICHVKRSDAGSKHLMSGDAWVLFAATFLDCARNDRLRLNMMREFTW
jgi:hypothetical protein